MSGKLEHVAVLSACLSRLTFEFTATEESCMDAFRFCARMIGALVEVDMVQVASWWMVGASANLSLLHLHDPSLNSLY